jgi:hypothetical protein
MAKHKKRGKKKPKEAMEVDEIHEVSLRVEEKTVATEVSRAEEEGVSTLPLRTDLNMGDAIRRVEEIMVEPLCIYRSGIRLHVRDMGTLRD